MRRTLTRAAPPAILLAAATLIAAAAACSGDPSGPSGPPDPPDPSDPSDSTELRVEVDGRLERGFTLALSVFEDDDPVPSDSVTWSVEPSGAAVFPSNDSASLLAAGTVVLSAQARGGTGDAEIDVAVPPTVVFDLLADGNRDIHRIALDGGDAARITTDPGDDRSPSAVGGTVVFTSYRDGNAEIYTAALDGGGGTAVPVMATADDETQPALSPDGERIAFVSDDTGVGKLWIVDAADGAGAERLTEGLGHGGSIEASPSWAPDSDRIAYLSTERGDADLFAITSGDGAQSPLVVHDDADVEPAWSPDGERVAFASNRDGSTDLYLLEIATGDVVRLTDRDETDAHPDWTADGRIVYLARVDGEARLRWLDPDSPDDTVHEIDVGTGTPGSPAIVR